MNRQLSILFPLIAALPAYAQDAPVRVSNRDQVVAALNQAKPGTTILIEPGTYRGGLSRDNLQGTADRPIVIAAADPERPRGLCGREHFPRHCLINIRTPVGHCDVVF